MIDLLAVLIIFILFFISFERNFIKYGILEGLVWSLLQTIKLSETMSVGFLGFFVMFFIYTIIAITVSYIFRNWSSRFSYATLCIIIYNILSYLVFVYFIIEFIAKLY